ncbi:MAG: cyclic nucleotide-binding/CBS domain-containing protein [Bradymonadaceae bacterium]
MQVQDICQTKPVTVEIGSSAREAAFAMREHHVGDVLVVDPVSDGELVGIVTDRDLVVDVVAEGATDLDSTNVEDVMSRDPVSVAFDEPADDALSAMRNHGVRRLPVRDGSGGLFGIVTLDDLLSYMTHQMASLGGIVGAEIRKEVEKDQI